MSAPTPLKYPSFTKVDLACLECRQTVFALLLPASSSTYYSALLRQNSARAVLVPIRNRFRASSDITAPAYGGIPHRSKRDSSASKRERKRQQIHQPIIVLEQCRETARLSFGMSRSSDVALAHPRNSDFEKACYINQKHAEFSSNPKLDSVMLRNPSTSIFKASGGGYTQYIPPSGSVSLDKGEWRISLGEGLDFLLAVCPDSLIPRKTTGSVLHHVPMNSILTNRDVAARQKDLKVRDKQVKRVRFEDQTSSSKMSKVKAPTVMHRHDTGSSRIVKAEQMGPSPAFRATARAPLEKTYTRHKKNHFRRVGRPR